jgi:protocatechuate 3,4-dioxygenase alpha subunit
MIRTPSQTVGPYYAIGLCRSRDNELEPGGVELTGQLLDGRNDPIADGMVELWDPVGKRWARSGTDGDGRFSFRVSNGGPPYLYVFVFARGLLRHQLTRMYFPDAATDSVLASLANEDAATLVAHSDGDGLRFDIRMQGPHATVFFEH